MEICAVRLDNADMSGVENIYKFLTKEKIEKAVRYRREEDKSMALVSDILARYLICKWMNIRNKQVEFEKNEYGKPALKNYNGIYFNISHSNNMVVCAINSSPIGIDVECMNDMDMDMAKEFLTEREYIEFGKKSSKTKLDYFYTIWTLKESYVKAWGKGLSIPLKSVEIKIDNDNIDIITMNEFKHCYFKMFETNKKYKIAVCSVEKFFAQEIYFKGFGDLVNDFMIYCE